jgi:hypothetical protein
MGLLNYRADVGQEQADDRQVSENYLLDQLTRTAGRSYRYDEPMQRLECYRWLLSCDPEATRQCYAAIPSAGPESCGCAPCLNFVAARDRAYPADVRDLFHRLGITPLREAEVYHIARLDSGLHLYGGFLHFVGSIEEGKDAHGPSGAVDLETVNDHFSIGFTASAHTSQVPHSFSQSSLVQIEFSAEIPWVLPDPEPE